MQANMMPGAEDCEIWCVTMGKCLEEVKRKAFEGEIKKQKNSSHGVPTGFEGRQS